MAADFEKANSSSLNDAQALPEPDDYDEADVVLTKETVEAINKRLARDLLTFGAVRAHVGYYRCPWPCSNTVFREKYHNAVKQWIRYMEQNGWVLESNVRIAPKSKWRKAHDMRGDWFSVPMFDFVEIPIGAAFRKTDLQIVRTEVEVAS